MPHLSLPQKLEGFLKPKRYKIAYGGRGGSKSWNVARILLFKGTLEPLRILCAREIQRTIADSVHRLLADQIALLGLEDFYRVTENSIQGQNGTEFLFAGLRQQDIGKIKSFEGVDIAWCEEANTISKKSWDVLIPTIRKDGSEIWLTFNPELDTDETYVRFVQNPPVDSEVVFINWSDNPWFPETLDKERIALRARDPDAYENIWEGKCRSAVEGAIYSRELADSFAGKRIRPVPHDPILKVHTVWDLGWNDSMAIGLVQRSSSEIRFIGYIEGQQRTLADYVQELSQLKYQWATDWIPHDGQAKDYKSGKSAEEVLRALGRNPRIVEKLDIEAGIKAARLVFPRVYFDESKCQRLLHCLKRYRRTINQNTNEPGPPLHDENSHGADMFRYMAVAADQMTNEPKLGNYYASWQAA